MIASVNTRRDFLKAMGFSASVFAVSGCMPLREQSPPSAIESPKGQPNILWITCEDISPLLGCYGDAKARTPNIDKLADESLLYTKAFVTAPVCAPVRSALVTGVHATSLGTQHLRSEVKLPERIRCFPQVLRSVGYYCTINYKKD